jgi:hypothetical protein
MSMEDYNFARAQDGWATPVKIVQYNCTCGRTMKFESKEGVVAPQRTWVGLTDEEAQQTFARHNCTISTHLAGILTRAIEAKLKEKNT